MHRDTFSLANSSCCASLIFPPQPQHLYKWESLERDFRAGEKDWVVSGFMHFNDTSANETILWKSQREGLFFPPHWIWSKHVLPHRWSSLLPFCVSGRQSVKSLVNLSQGLGGYQCCMLHVRGLMMAHSQLQPPQCVCAWTVCAHGLTCVGCVCVCVIIHPNVPLCVSKIKG